MDPDAALARIRELAAEIIQIFDDDESYEYAEAEANEIAETFQGLDNWIKGGGFLPKDWRRKDGQR